MQVNRLLELIYILLDKKTVTARELSQHFEVSQRTIYRDIDALGAAGIPVYTNKGKGGGISLLENYVLKKSMFTDKEQNDILAALQGLHALSLNDTEPVLKKLAVIFNKSSTSWIDVDFSRWSSKPAEREKFNLLKASIINRKTIVFDYYASDGSKTSRIVEPDKIMFRGQDWYLYGFCRSRSQFRVFKITRIKNLVCTDEEFKRIISEAYLKDSGKFNCDMIKLVLKVEKNMAYRIYDEFEQENIVNNSDGSFTASLLFPDDDRVFSYIMSYGDSAEILEPKHIREKLKSRLKHILKKYL